MIVQRVVKMNEIEQNEIKKQLRINRKNIQAIKRQFAEVKAEKNRLISERKTLVAKAELISGKTTAA